MALTTQPAETDIETRLKTIVPRVYVTEVPDGVSPVYPYIVIYYGEPVRLAMGRGIVSTRQDTLRGFATIQVVAPTDAAANAVKNLVRETMTGFRPTDCGEMNLEGGGGYSKAANGVSPTLYYREVAMSWLTNLSWVN